MNIYMNAVLDNIEDSDSWWRKPMPDRMTDAEIAEAERKLAVARSGRLFSPSQYEDDSYIVETVAPRLLDELKAAREETDSLQAKMCVLAAEVDSTRAERDAARAQAFEEAMEIIKGSRHGWNAGYTLTMEKLRQLARHADSPDGSRTATPEVK